MKTFSLLLTLLLQTSLVMAQSNSNTLDSQFANPTNLTDEQMARARDFVHEGKRENYVKAECAKKGDACKEPTDGMQIEDMIRMAYSSMGMFLGTTLKKKPKAPEAGTQTAPAGGTPAGGQPANGQQANGGRAEAEEQTDYCIMGAMAYEAVGGMIQGSMQKKVENATAQESDIQLKALINLKETHKARAKTATWQGVVYTGVTACYGYMMMTGVEWKDPKFIIKMAGAGTLATLYVMKAAKHKKAAGDVQKIIDSLDKVGKDCNPWTGTACFCAEKTSQTRYPAEYEEVCVLNKGNPEGDVFKMACVAQNKDKKLALDEKCDCKKTNSCAKSPLKPFGGSVGVGANLMSQANKSFDLLGNGEFDRAQLDKAALNMGAMASRMKVPDGVLPKVALTPEQKKQADILASVMNPAVTGVAVTAKPSSFGSGIRESRSASVSKTPAPQEKPAGGEGVDVKYNQGGGGDNFAAAEPESAFAMPGVGQPEAADGTEVVSFAEEALSKADVSNAPSTPIFDIISNRYRMSGWKSLDTEGK